MAIKSGNVTVGTTATVVISNPPDGAYIFKNNGSVTVYLGPSTITADNNATTGGFELGAGDRITMQIQDGASLYGIATVAGQVVNFGGVDG